ncbi:MAG: hypothetical protein WA888_17045 [Burkholderiaceae bacterium]
MTLYQVQMCINCENTGKVSNAAHQMQYFGVSTVLAECLNDGNHLQDIILPKANIGRIDIIKINTIHRPSRKG